ncbi:hypothetical protein B0H10DRAFT_2221585 [Mycena sp. CBHHK59/15]|nr:hypothetical protein B0H10DRAFT_2221585 [Mycena sp. CBHHK59/15]
MANNNAVWHGAAPMGWKPKDPESSEAPSPCDTEDSEMSLLIPAVVPAKTIQSDDKLVPAARAQKKSQAQPPKELSDGDNADSNPEDRRVADVDPDVEEDRVDAADNNNKDLEILAVNDPGALSKVLALETPQWMTMTSDDGNDDDECGHQTLGFQHLRPSSRPSSRASMSSGHMSVPSSAVSSDSDSDPETNTAFASLKKAQQCVPLSAEKAPAAAVPSLFEKHVRSKGKAPVRGKREIARDHKPVGQHEKKPISIPSTSKVKIEDIARPLYPKPQHTVKQEAFIKGSPSLASKYSELFVTNVNGKKEVPIPMVALAGTAVHAALSEHCSGRHVPSKFEGNSLQEVYDTHLLLLDRLCQANSTVLEDLYAVLSGGSHLGDIASKPMAIAALAVLGL